MRRAGGILLLLGGTLPRCDASGLLAARSGYHRRCIWFAESFTWIRRRSGQRADRGPVLSPQLVDIAVAQLWCWSLGDGTEIFQ
jgi:hypothetical protein